MNTLLVFFALPVATIILAVVLEKQIRCPLQVAAVFFAIYLIVTFAVFDASFLVFAIVYTILAYIAAVITKIVCDILRDDSDENCGCYGRSGCRCRNRCRQRYGCSQSGNDIATLSVNENSNNNSVNNNNVSNLAAINSNGNVYSCTCRRCR